MPKTPKPKVLNPDEDIQLREPSVEYKNFESLLKQVVSVPKSEIDARFKAEKDAKQKK